MELQELKSIWGAYDQSLEQQLKVNKFLLKKVSLDKVRSLMGNFKWNHILEIIFNVLVMMFLMNFIIENFSHYKFSVPAIILYILTIASLIFNIFNIIEIYKLNLSIPVIEAQKKLEKLKLYERWEVNSLLILIPICSVLFLVVFCKAVMGIDIYGIFPYWWIKIAAGSFIAGLVIVYLLKKYPDKKMNDAIDFLKEIERFEKESN